MSRARIRVGSVPVDVLGFDAAIEAITELVKARRGGTVFTPNVDHVVMAQRDDAFRAAYAGVSLSLVDGMPVLWASRLLGTPLPEKVSGSDLVVPLARRAATEGFRVYLLGGGPGVAAQVHERLQELAPGIRVVGAEGPRVDADPLASGNEAIIQRVEAARPDLVLVALGAPKQELLCAAYAARLAPAVLVAVGAGLDFIAGTVRRAPKWMSRSGFEWLYRLALEPRRLAGRYLGRDPQFLTIVARQLLFERSASPRD
jgi:N-acetylglucosaminyldiphosphoundecaprenol N-acetyl-beta-D-mannosaminyltransferase